MRGALPDGMTGAQPENEGAPPCRMIRAVESVLPYALTGAYLSPFSTCSMYR